MQHFIQKSEEKNGLWEYLINYSVTLALCSKCLPKLLTHTGYCSLFFLPYFLWKSSNCTMTLVVSSYSGRDGTKQAPSSQFSKARSNTYRTWTVRAYTDAERFDIIRERSIITPLEIRKQVFARLFLFEIFSNLMWGVCVGEWPWSCWGEHHMGTFCSPSPCSQLFLNSLPVLEYCFALSASEQDLNAGTRGAWEEITL